MFAQIVVPIDGSELSKKVIDTALFMARDGATITFVHVVKNLPIYLASHLMILGQQAENDYMEEARKYGKELLEDACETAKNAGINCEKKLLFGDPANSILSCAENGQSDVIIMGSRGLGDFKELMLGSVSHRVTQMAPCPVFIVK
ncbi:universal stress protein [Brevibacillus daliensis]|uniref:universal stress protein n=1 Tax=Brevibacillus daliensis TaxID=2892995 RepID=UPI001E48A2C1|nr:universal stress protein [Brevibacillus daliensis]